MKIVFLLDGIYEYASGSPRAVGGAERDQWRLARALVAAGWSATIAVRGELTAGERRIIDGVEYVGIDQGQVLLAWHKFLSSEQPDWLFWECSSHLLGPIVEIAKFKGIKTIFHAAFDTDFELRKALGRRPRWWPLYAWGLSRTDKIFVQHTGQLSSLRPRWQSKAYLLPKVCFFADELGKNRMVTPHAEREKYVAWVAVLRQHKRPDVLIEIARKAPAIRFVVCGGPDSSVPSYSERIIQELRATPNIEYLGHVAPEKAEQVIAGAAVFLSTSDEEGFPNTFVQAWTCGTPVVSLKIDPDRIIEKVGLGTVSENVARVIADINALIDSPHRREDMAIRARQFVGENYSAAAVVSLFERALDGVH